MAELKAIYDFFTIILLLRSHRQRGSLSCPIIDI